MVKKYVKTIGRWIKNRLVRIPERDHYVSAWLIVSFLIVTTISAMIVALSNPVGVTPLSHVMNIGLIVILNGIIFLLWTSIVAALLSLLYIPLPRLFLGSFSYTFISTLVILKIAKSGTLFSFIIAIIYSFIAILIGLIMSILFHKKISKTTKITTLVTILILASIYLAIDQNKINENEVPVIAEPMSPVIDENPAMEGRYDYNFFTYGSGDDLHREQFGEAVDQRTPTVDASHFITEWSEKRELFWGFDQAKLPVNGRVWLPEGQGTFPIILMVHGNHTMEHFSTSGYDYLGELLASRGFIAISVDQDFVNYSNTYGIPNNNYQLRTWLLLQHLVHLQQMNDDPNHYLYQKIDFQNTALVGHSRGGQAALMAADHNTFFEDEQLLEHLEKVDIKAVVAIAPTDKSIDGKRPRIHNTSYLLMHGARDADVSTFRDQPFYRTTFDHDYNGFKTSIYIADANHTHFNSDWGSMDLSLPKGIFLNQKQTLSTEDQQEIAKVYVSAFFESVFHGRSSYEKLFQDHRYGRDWLPHTIFVNKYKHASYRPILTFKQRDKDLIDGDGFTKSDVMTPKDRSGNKRLSDALQLEWEADASYTGSVINDDFITSNHLVFTMANLNEDAGNVPDLHIELGTSNGVAVSLRLEDYMPFPPVISTDYTHFGIFDQIFRNDKYKDSWEPVFQTFDIPIQAFEKEHTDFRKENIDKITIHFKTRAGKIAIEEIGVW